MVYNYLELDSINKWPKEKKILLLKLLDIDIDDSMSIVSEADSVLDSFKNDLGVKIF